ncbi:MAG TPA: hypothetical protein VN026_18830 [Bacteroidia bacterium]|nr:hypothetical protein [Bacteroidia bacterium]
MNKLLLLLAVFMISITSCQKNAGNNGPYTCTCQYILVTGAYSRDTTTNTTYPNGTTITIAQQNCQNTQTTLRAVNGLSANCYIK